MVARSLQRVQDGAPVQQANAPTIVKPRQVAMFLPRGTIDLALAAPRSAAGSAGEITPHPFSVERIVLVLHAVRKIEGLSQEEQQAGPGDRTASSG